MPKKEFYQMNNVCEHSELFLNLGIIGTILVFLTYFFSAYYIKLDELYILSWFKWYPCWPKYLTTKCYFLKYRIKLRHEHTGRDFVLRLQLFLKVILALFKRRISDKTETKILCENCVWYGLRFWSSLDMLQKFTFRKNPKRLRSENIHKQNFTLVKYYNNNICWRKVWFWKS